MQLELAQVVAPNSKAILQVAFYEPNVSSPQRQTQRLPVLSRGGLQVCSRDLPAAQRQAGLRREKNPAMAARFRSSTACACARSEQAPVASLEKRLHLLELVRAPLVMLGNGNHIMALVHVRLLEVPLTSWPPRAGVREQDGDGATEKTQQQ